MTGIAPTLGWIVAAASAVAVTAFVIVDHRHPRGLAHVLGSAAAVVTFSAFPALGAAVLTRHPAHRLGWLFTGVGAAITIGSTCAAIVDVARPGSTAWTVAAILADVGWIAAVGPPTALLGLLLPDGELLSRRWRPVAAISGTFVTVLAIATALRPDLGYAGRANPIGLAIAGPLVNDGGLVAPVLLASGIASCWLRFRRSRGVERLQLTWIVATFLTVIALSLADGLAAQLSDGRYDGMPEVVQFTLWGLIPASFAVAIFRYRLYGIAVIVRRTLVYSTLVILLGALYLGAVTGLGAATRAVTGQSGTLAVTFSTLLVAAAFQPLRRRIVRAVDRRFYRARYDAAETVERFADRLRDEVDVDALGAAVVHLVSDTLRPAHATVWLRHGRAR